MATTCGLWTLWGASMSREWTVGAIKVPGRWLVKELEDSTYGIYWCPYDCEPECRGTAKNRHTAMSGARAMLDDMEVRLGLKKKEEPNRARKKGDEVDIKCEGQLTIFDGLEQSS